MKKTRRLTLSRETILCLNDTALAGGVAADVIGVTVQDTQQMECYSPLCVPTYWKTCETNVAG